jgi:hypothetical protein
VARKPRTPKPDAAEADVVEPEAEVSAAAAKADLGPEFEPEPQRLTDETLVEQPTARPSLRLGSLALGAMALGAFAIGFLAVGRLAIGRASVGRARLGKVRIDELVVRKLTVLSVDDRR